MARKRRSPTPEQAARRQRAQNQRANRTRRSLPPPEGDVGGALHHAGSSGEGQGFGQPPPGGGGQPPAAPPSFFPGLPPELAQQVANYLRSGGDEDGAMALIRASQWYSHEYAGIQYGIQNLGWDAQNPEAQYRAWKNQARDAYSRYYGQPMSEEQITLFLQNGWEPQRIEQEGQSRAWVQSQGLNAQYALGAFGQGQLTQSQLEALGQSEIGLGNTMGDTLRGQLELALQKVQKVFSGNQGTGFNLNQSLGDIVQKRAGSTDIGA